MKKIINSSNSIFRILLQTTLPILFALILAGCPQPTTGQTPNNGDGSTAGTEDGVQQIEPTSFAWDTVRREPRWRSNSPIEWISTIDPNEVFTKARESGKPILCYISRYDLDVTATIEDALFIADSWGQKIQDNFIPWELNWWEAPGLAENILAGSQPPALAVIIPNPDPSSSEFRIADIWSGQTLLSFPLQTGRLPLGTPEADAKIAGYQAVSWESLPVITLEPRGQVVPDDLASSTFSELAGLMDGGSATTSFDVLCALYGNPLNETIKTKAADRVNAWFDYMGQIGTDTFWMPDNAFSPGSGWGIYPENTVEAFFTSAVVSPDTVRNLDKLVTALGSLLYLEGGNPGGGIPPYIDIRGTFVANTDYINDDYDVLGTGGHNFENAVMGPRDIPWVNAKILAFALELAAIHPAMMDMELKPGVTFRQFIELGSNNLISKIVEDARSQGTTDVAALGAVLGLLNIAYQHTSDPQRLEVAGKIAEMFPPGEIDTWFDASQYQFYPDFAIGLYHYGWLGDSEDSRETARLITEKCAEYAGYMNEAELRRLVYAHNIVHSPCPHVGIVGSIDDERSWTLLSISFQDWDPRKVAQVLDPVRDKVLIEAKWYAIQDEPTAYVCVDDSCYPPSSDPEELADVIKQVLNDLAQESKE
ncbi:MAG: hypothetical protein NTY09_06505 [bacterium]|nr:hypothetical protein [bacterium]